MIKRLALLTGLTLALAAPAHAGKRAKANDLNLDGWLELVQTLQTAAASGNLSAADTSMLVGEIWSTVADTWIQDTGKRGRKGKKAKKRGKNGKKGKKGKAARNGTVTATR